MTQAELLDLVSFQFAESASVKKAFAQENSQKILNAAISIVDRLREGGKILICGNGGSASDSLHFSGEALGKLQHDRPPFACVSLTGDVATLTAVGNDYGFEHIFSRQVQALGNNQDVLIAISTSGNSANVLRAVDVARSKEMLVVGLTGGSGGKLTQLCDHSLCVSEGKSTMRIQETHIVVLHTLALLVEKIWVQD